MEGECSVVVHTSIVQPLSLSLAHPFSSSNSNGKLSDVDYYLKKERIKVHNHWHSHLHTQQIITKTKTSLFPKLQFTSGVRHQSDTTN